MNTPETSATFPKEHQQAVDGLAWLGYLTDTFTFCGHRFTIRTLYGHEELLASLLAKEYLDTLGQAKAWAWAHVALSLTAVDGDPHFCPPIGPDEMEYAQARFNYVTKKWFWPLGDYVFTRYAALAQRQVDALKALQDLSNRSLRPTSPSADSLNEQGTSSEQITSDDLS